MEKIYCEIEPTDWVKLNDSLLSYLYISCGNERYYKTVSLSKQKAIELRNQLNQFIENN